MSAQPTTATSWPKGVVARYLTVGGATVDVDDTPHWRCTGCPGTSYGAYTNPWDTPFTPAAIAEQAQTHAEKCRAMPKPEASNQ